MRYTWDTDSDKLGSVFVEGILDRARSRIGKSKTHAQNAVTYAKNLHKSATKKNDKIEDFKDPTTVQISNYINKLNKEIMNDLDKLVGKTPNAGAIEQAYYVTIDEAVKRFIASVDRIQKGTSLPPELPAQQKENEIKSDDEYVNPNNTGDFRNEPPIKRPSAPTNMGRFPY